MRGSSGIAISFDSVCNSAIGFFGRGAARSDATHAIMAVSARQRMTKGFSRIARSSRMAGPSTRRGLGESTTRPHGGDRSRFRRRAGPMSNVSLVYSPVGRRAFFHTAGNERPSQPGLGNVVSSSFSGIRSSCADSSPSTCCHGQRSCSTETRAATRSAIPTKQTPEFGTTFANNPGFRQSALELSSTERGEWNTSRLKERRSWVFSRNLRCFVALGRLMADFVRLGYLHFPVGNSKSATFWSKSAISGGRRVALLGIPGTFGY